MDKLQKSQIFVEMIVESWWKQNEQRAKQWIENYIDSHDHEPWYDLFEEEFPFDSGYNEPTVNNVLHEQLYVIDLAGYRVNSPLVDEFERKFDALLLEVMESIKQQEIEKREFEFEYREVG